MSRQAAKRYLVNPIAAGIFFGFSFLRNILLVSLLLGAWGEFLFRFWVVIISSRTLLAFIPDGFGRYIANRYNLDYHADRSTATRTLHSGLAFMMLFNGVFFVILALACLGFDTTVMRLFNVPKGTVAAFSLAYTIVASAAAGLLHNTARFCAAVNEPTGRYWESFAFEGLVVLVETSAIVLAIYRGEGIVATTLASSVAVAVLSVLYMVVLRRREELRGFKIAKTLVVTGAGHFRKASAYTINNFFEKLTTESSVILLSLMRFSPALFPIYSSVRTFANVPVTAANLLTVSLVPELQRSYAVGNGRRMLTLLQSVWFLAGLAAGIGLIGGYPFLVRFYTDWTRFKLSFSNAFFPLMLGVGLTIVFGGIIGILLKSINAVRSLLWVAMAKGAVLIMLFLALPKTLVVLGAVLLATEGAFQLIILPALMSRILPGLSQQDARASILRGAVPYLLTLFALVYIAVAGYSKIFAGLFLLVLLGWALCRMLSVRSTVMRLAAALPFGKYWRPRVRNPH